MARSINSKCLTCSRLSVSEAREIHGPRGDGCWNEKTCHRRRSHYRHRGDNNSRRRSLKKGHQTIAIAAETPPVAYLYLYREKRKDALLHAIAVSVWQGSEKILEIEPMHCAGMRNQQVNQYLQAIQLQLDDRFGIRKFESVLRLEPAECPIQNCPLTTLPGKNGA